MGARQFCTCGILGFDEPNMYRHGLGTLETERSNMSHIVDMINIEMFTIDDYPISCDDRTWVS